MFYFRAVKKKIIFVYIFTQNCKSICFSKFILPKQFQFIINDLLFINYTKIYKFDNFKHLHWYPGKKSQ